MKVFAMHNARVSLFASGLLAVIAANHQFAMGEPTDSQRPGDIHVAEALSRSFRRAASLVEPSIVTIQTISRTQDPAEHPDDPYDYGDATGVIVDGKGWIVTNAHVIENVEVVYVRLPDGREFRTAEVRADRWSDLAIVRLRGAGKLPVPRLGNSDDLRVGDWVVAAGNAFGMGLSINPGTISAKHRSLPDTNIMLIQTNAATNPGNSGGPLVNLRGEVMGISEGAYSMDGGFDGIGFAIPANTVNFVVKELIQHGFVRWPYLGVSCQTLSPDIALKIALSNTHKGAIVTHVTPKSAAELAGLSVGDVITRFRQELVENVGQLWLLIEQTPLGESIELTAIRNGQTFTRQVRLQGRRLSARPRRHEAAAAVVVRSTASPIYLDRQLGIAVTDLSATQTPKPGFPQDVQGVYVQEVRPWSTAHLARIHEGTIVVRVGNKPVNNMDEFKSAIKEQNLDDGILLLVWSPFGTQNFVVLRPDPNRTPNSFDKPPTERPRQVEQSDPIDVPQSVMPIQITTD